MPRVRSVDCPNVDILLLRAADGGIKIRGLRPKISAKIVDAGREQDYGAPVRGRWPSFHHIQKREIGARELTPAAERQAQSLGHNILVGGEILDEHRGTLCGCC